MDIKAILQDDRKKKVLIIGVIVFLILLGLLFIFTRKSAPQTDTSGQTQLLTDIAQLAPRDSASQSENRMVAPIIALSADTPTVAPGQPATITWSSKNAVSCTDGDGNKVNTVGSLSITPRENYTLDIVCTNTKGTTLESVTVAVTTSPIIALSASPESVRLGEQSFISWNTVNTTRCVDSAGKTLRLSDGFSVAPRKAYTFEINCTGPKGTGKKSVTVTIASAQSTSGTTKPTTTTSGTTQSTTNTNANTTITSGTTRPPANTTAPTVTVSTNKTTLSPGQTATVSWTSVGATSCTGRTPTGVEVVKQDGTTVIVRPADGSVPVPTTGNMQIRVLAGKATATIIISCVGPGGATEKTITVNAAIAALASGPPTITLSANPATVNAAGEQSYISWNTTNATNCTGGVEKNTWAEWYEPVNNVWQNIHDLQTGLGINGSARVYPGGADPSPLFAPQTQSNSGFGFFSSGVFTPQSTTFTVTCTGPLGSATKSVTVTIVPPAGSCGTGILGLGCGFW